MVADKIRASVQEINDQINQEIVQTTQFFIQHESIEDLSEVKYVFLAGGASVSLDLAGSLSSAIKKLPVQIMNPFQKIDPGSSGVDMEYLLNQGTIYGIALGLAMRKVGD